MAGRATAERFVPLPVMPKGVEHAKLQCGTVPITYVPLPVMPKGVEHTTSARGPARFSARVPLPVMPKGVEHTMGRGLHPQAQAVPLPVMPKGVEHTTANAADYDRRESAPPSDAERR